MKELVKEVMRGHVGGREGGRSGGRSCWGHAYEGGRSAVGGRERSWAGGRHTWRVYTVVDVCAVRCDKMVPVDRGGRARAQRHYNEPFGPDSLSASLTRIGCQVAHVCESSS